MLMAQKSGKPPTLAQIGRLCQLDKSTVYRALCGVGRVSPQTVARVRDVAEQLGYDPARNRAAQRLAAQRLDASFINHTVALILPKGFYQFSYYHRIHAGILNGVAEREYDLLTVQGTLENMRVPRSVAAGEVDAVIVVGGSCDAQVLKRLRVPIVCVAQEFPGAARVMADDRRAGFLAADHLLSLGHRAVFHFFPKEAPVTRLRIHGYRDAAVAHGLDPNQTILGIQLEHHTNAERSRWLAEHLALGLAKYPHTTAMIAPNDADARIIYDLLQARNLRVPTDISLIGCDDAATVTDGQGRNILSSIDISLYDLGQEAARLAIDIVRSKASADTCLVLPARLVARSSTAPPRPTT
jgi:DNA-binding LacI/PurR family transcriptional regulator